MIKSKLFVRFALLGVLISAIMLVVSIFTTQWSRDLIFAEPFRDRGPFRAVVRLIENMQPADRVQGLRDLQSRPFHPPMPGEHFEGHSPDDRGGRGQMPPQMPPPEFRGEPGSPPRDHEGAPGGPQQSPFFDFVLLDENGVVLFPPSLNESKIKELHALVQKLKQNPNEVYMQNDQTFLQRLEGTPTQYLARGARFHPPTPPPGQFVLLMSIQLLSTMFAVLLTLGAVLYSIRQRANEAEEVIRHLSAGNLKARIPITKMDEIGHVMFSFNKMADEIEHLIEHLRKTEHARRDLLRELAHDLRTPVASLKSLIETVNERADQLPKEKRRELLDLAMREADYFEGLVDDLLFLGRVQEPKYKTTSEKFDLKEMILHEIEAISHRNSHVDIRLHGPDELMFNGDPGLVKRLVRNALENAASFAKSKVEIQLSGSRDVEILVSDDGPGFDAASLASFGQRKYSRAIINGPTKRISIGLGSVIMKSIVDAYRGDLRASNRVDETTRDIQGADIFIRLPVV